MEKLEFPRTSLLSAPPSLPGDPGEQLAERVRRIHAHVARTTTERAPNAYAQIAVHYDRAGSRDRAFQYAMLVADRFKREYAYDQAVEYLRLAERNADTAGELAAMRARLAEVTELQGRYADALSLCELALAHFGPHGDRRRALGLQRMRERLHGALGQPFRRTLGACLILDEEAKELGLDDEHVALLTMISQMHSRLGEREAAERTARECVELAEELGDPALLADALNRLGLACERPDEAAEYYRRALDAYRTLEDRRGQARCHNNLGIHHTRKGDWMQAELDFADALALSRSARLQDLWGLAAMNLAVVYQKRGEFRRARDYFGEAFAVFSASRNAEHELYALYNLADLDRERGEHAIAAEMFDVARQLAKRLGQSDVEIGALGGAGLAMLRLGRAEAAAAAMRDASELMLDRAGAWFQGRETVEALAIGLDAAAGRTAEALSRLAGACAQAEAEDLYSAAWLAAEAAAMMGVELRAAETPLRGMLERYADRVRDLRCAELDRRLATLLAS